jgi:hypothetical protein
MKTWTRQLLFWSPRFLVIGLALFLSLLALDVFGEGRGFWGTALALFMHLVPVYIVVITLVIAWRREWIGAILFPALAVLYVFLSWGKLHWSAFLAITVPLFLIGVLFGANRILRNRQR